MGKHEDGKSRLKATPNRQIMSPASETEAPPMMALSELLKPEVPEPASPGIEVGQIETVPIDSPTIDLAEAPRIAPEFAEFDRPAAHDAFETMPDEPEPPAEVAAPRVNRFTLLAACLALAAAFGGMLGALAAFGLAGPEAAPAITAGRIAHEEIQALKENVIQARVDLAALKTSIEAANRYANGQFTKIAERVERMERSSAEPAAKLSKAIEHLDRLSRNEATGTVTPPQPAGANQKAVEGWVLRDVHRGTAFLEGRAGIIEVEQGDTVPGLGRVEAIRKQDGRWVVVTPKGTLTTGR